MDQSSEKLKVLLIEHDAAFARTVSAMLEQARDTIGRVAVAPSLAQALGLLATEKPDVVILDFFLPDGAGLMNIPLLRERAPRIPIIIIGAAEDEAFALEAVHAGAQDYLVKAHLSTRGLLRSIRYTMERHSAEMAVVAAEEKYRGLFNHLVEGIFQTTADGSYLMANPALARIYGYASAEELMNSVTDIGRRLYVRPGRREEFKRTMEASDTITGFESEIFRKDGSIIWISENCRAVRDDHGKLLHYEGTVEDITLRRAAEQNLLNSESLYHSLVETMPQNVFRKDLQGRFTFANQQYCRDCGCKLEDILGKTDFDFCPKELAEKYQSDDRRVMATGQTYETVEEHQPLGRGKTFVQVFKTPLYGADGTVIGLQGIFWDVTEQKLAEERIRQAQQSLRESEALYHSLVETMPQCIFRKDVHGRYTFANPEFCRVLSRRPEEILGRTIYDFLPEELANQRDQDDLKVMRAGKPLEHIEESMFGGDGPRFIQVLKLPIFDGNGKVVGLQGMFWDITEMKLAEERIRKAHAELARSQEELRLKNLLMQDDLKMAREIQVTMLPQQYPALPRGVNPAESAFQFTHRYLPTGTVGGDFFSVTALSDTEVAVFICDVAGHGVRSALITAMIRAIVEELRPLGSDPGQFMTKLNSDIFAILKHSGSPVLTTAFYLVADCTTGAVRYANAGHPTPLHLQRRAGRIEPLPRAAGKNQPALGLFEVARYQTSQGTLAPGDLLMLFTDGLIEVYAPNQEIYTQALLTEATRKRIALPAPQLFDEVVAEIRAYSATGEFDDDVCMVGLEFTGPAAAKAG